MDNTIKCPRCGLPLSDESSFCQYCGTKIEEKDIPSKCPKCGLTLPQDSAFCQYCGTKIEAEDSSSASETSMPVYTTAAGIQESKADAMPQQKELQGGKKRIKKRSKMIIKLIFLSVLVLLVLGIGFCGYNYSRFRGALEKEHYNEAYRYYKLIPFASDIFTNLEEYLNAGILLENGEYINAYHAFSKVNNVPVSVFDEIKEKIYSIGQTAYRNKDYSKATEYFDTLYDYKRCQDYSLLIACNSDGGISRLTALVHYSELIELVNEGFENSDEVLLHNSSSASRFLTSRWEDGSRNPCYFELSDNGASYNLPHKDANGYYSISDGIFSIVDSNGENSTKVFRFSIIDEDTINVYCFKDGSTHTLYRQ